MRMTTKRKAKYNEDSTGRRIAWARKHVEWTDDAGEMQVGMSGIQFGLMLTTDAEPDGVGNVYVSQLENNHRKPSLALLKRIAEVTGVTVGFLLMEMTDPYPVVDAIPAEPEPVYFSPEADAAAQMIDAAPPGERARMLAVLRAMMAAEGAPEAQQVIAEKQGNKRVITNHPIYSLDEPPAQRRLILGQYLGEKRESTRA